MAKTSRIARVLRRVGLGRKNSPALPKKETVKSLLKKLRALRKERRFDEAEILGLDSLASYPTSMALLSELSIVAVKSRQWSSAIERLERMLAAEKKKGARRDRTVCRLVDVFVALGQPAEAALRLENELVNRPRNLVLTRKSAALTLLQHGATAAAEIWRNIALSPGLLRADPWKRVSMLAECVAGLRLGGFPDEARDLLIRHLGSDLEAWKRLNDGRALLILFDNGITRVEYRARLFDPGTMEICEPESLLITFDHMDGVWTREPYGYRPFANLPVDLISVRKFQKRQFHQDFKREDFLGCVGPYVSLYRQKMASGQSLGAYCALYYATCLEGCRVLATAPQNPQNPKYGGDNEFASYRDYRHEYDIPVNAVARPTVVYDPKHPLDGPYIERSLKRSFPNGSFVPYPYCGHKIAAYLREVGILKQATLDFQNGAPFPQFDRTVRGNSSEYLITLAEINARSGRLRWARALATKALEHDTNVRRAQRKLREIARLEDKAARKNAGSPGEAGTTKPQTRVGKHKRGKEGRDVAKKVELFSVRSTKAIAKRRWADAIRNLERLLVLQTGDDERADTVSHFAEIFVGLGQPQEAAMRVYAELASRPGSLPLARMHAALSLLLRGGMENSDPWRALAAMPALRTAPDDIRLPTIGECVAGLRLTGQLEEARQLMMRHFDPENPAWKECLKDGFAELTVFNNGKTRLKLFEKLFDPATMELVEPAQLAITFDVMGANWAMQPYGYKPLAALRVSILAQQKHGRKDFHQDFRRGDFLTVAGPLARRFSDVVAMGHSLGGYCALYYAAGIEGCRILASSPRHPQNPKYSKSHHASWELYSHEYDMPGSAESKATILFDPKDSTDGRYVESCLKPRFPAARFVAYRYCGHRISAYLRDVGVLKCATLGFIAGRPFPGFDRTKRGSSPEFLLNLAKLNLGAGRVRLARTLALRAREIGGDVQRVDRLLGKIAAATSTSARGATGTERLFDWLRNVPSRLRGSSSSLVNRLD